MARSLYETQKQELIGKIEAYDELIKGYQSDDLPRETEELETLTIDELNDWLKTRMTRYQFQIENEIAMQKTECGNER